MTMRSLTLQADNLTPTFFPGLFRIASTNVITLRIGATLDVNANQAEGVYSLRLPGGLSHTLQEEDMAQVDAVPRSAMTLLTDRMSNQDVADVISWLERRRDQEAAQRPAPRPIGSKSAPGSSPSDPPPQPGGFSLLSQVALGLLAVLGIAGALIGRALARQGRGDG